MCILALVNCAISIRNLPGYQKVWNPSTSNKNDYIIAVYDLQLHDKHPTYTRLFEVNVMLLLHRPWSHTWH